MYLLDADVLSNLLKPRPGSGLLSRLVQIPDSRLSTSSISFGEILCGTYLLGAQGVGLRERTEETALRNVSILPFDEQAARRYAPLKAELEQRGTPIGDADTRIAAIALVHDLTVITGNVRHFELVPNLRVENWLT